MRHTPLLCWLLLFAAATAVADTPRMVLDADTANELDDLHAIARVLLEVDREVVALNSAQWQHYLTDTRRGTAVEQSHRLNEDLVRLLGRTEVPLFLGSVQPMGRPWGGSEPKDSPAAQAIVRLARETPPGEKLDVVCIGASTNLASALAMAPEITPRVRAYLLGFQYDVATGVWNKSEFNIRRDLNAADHLLNLEDLELWVMPASVSIALRFEREATRERESKLGDLGAYLTARWDEVADQNDTRIMWDLALVQAILRPEQATVELRPTPPENTAREINVYTAIDAAAMERDYWRTLDKWHRRMSR